MPALAKSFLNSIVVFVEPLDFRYKKSGGRERLTTALTTGSPPVGNWTEIALPSSTISAAFLPTGRFLVDVSASGEVAI